MLNNSTSFNALPVELLLYLSSFLELSDMFKFRATSKELLEVFTDRDLWIRRTEQTLSSYASPPFFDLQRMKAYELERIACVPTMLDDSLGCRTQSTKQFSYLKRPRFHLSAGDLESQGVKGLHLVPGGQFLVGTGPSNLVVWNLPFGPWHPNEPEPRMIAFSYPILPSKMTIFSVFVHNVNILKVAALTETSLVIFQLPLDQPFDAGPVDICTHSYVPTPPIPFKYSIRRSPRYFTWMITQSPRAQWAVCDIRLERVHRVTLKGLQSHYIKSCVPCRKWLICHQQGSAQESWLSVFDLDLLSTSTDPTLNSVSHLHLESSPGKTKQWDLRIAPLGDSFVMLVASSPVYDPPPTEHAFLFEIREDGELIFRGDKILPNFRTGLSDDSIEGSGWSATFNAKERAVRYSLACCHEYGSLCWGSLRVDEESKELKGPYNHPDAWIFHRHPERWGSSRYRKLSTCAFSGRVVEMVRGHNRASELSESQNDFGIFVYDIIRNPEDIPPPIRPSQLTSKPVVKSESGKQRLGRWMTEKLHSLVD